MSEWSDCKSVLKSKAMFMKRTTRTLALLLGAAALAAWRAPAQTPAATNPLPSLRPTNLSDLFPDTVVAKGKGVEIKRSRLEEEVIRTKGQYAAQGRPIPPEQTPLVEQQILEGLIQFQLLLAKATPADKLSGKELAGKKMEEAKTQLGEERLNQQLKLANITRAEQVSQWADKLAARNMLVRDLKINITDEDVKKFYDDNPAKFEQPEMVRASHILLLTNDPNTRAELTKEQKEAKHKQMEDLLKRARAGEDFAKLAKEFSEDPGVKQNGGEYVFSRSDLLVPEFKAAAFSLHTNQVSDIVTTQYGYHIIKLTEKIPAKKIELAKVSDRVKEDLISEAVQKQLPEYYQKLRKEADIQILDERLKPREGPAGLPPGPPPRPADTKSGAKSE